MIDKLPTLRWLIAKHFPAARHRNYTDLARYWLEWLDRQRDNKGLRAFDMAKAVRNHVTKFLAGEPVLHSIDPQVGINKSGLPRALGPLMPLVRGDTLDLRFLMTLLTVSREMHGWKPVDWSPIVDAPKADLQLVDLDRLASHVTKFETSIIPTDWDSPHITSKAGPQGLALDYAMEDLRLLPESGIAKDIVLLGGEPLKEWMNEAFWLLENLPLSPQTARKGNTLRRISVKNDKEGKSRVFAILDYWSQASLRTLHSEILKILKRIPSDCTFDQGSRLHKVSPNPFFHSIDLTNATDRFPIDLQVKVLERLIGSDKAQAWKRIMVNLPFSIRSSSPTKEISYGAGQPMGAYSSWPVFALCHHLVVQEAADRAGLMTYSNYMLLGDDIVLGDDKVAKHYLDILRELGVETSDKKTHTSKTTLEFAKRWIHGGTEITGVSLSALSNYTGPSAVIAWLEQIERNWNLPLQAYSRSDLVSLLRTISPRVQKIHLESVRIWEGRLIPLSRTSYFKQEERVFRCCHYLLKDMEKCRSSWESYFLTLIQAIPVVKMKYGQIAIKETVKNVNTYMIKLIKRIAASPDFDRGLLPDLPQLVQSLPVIRAALAFAKDGQAELDRMDNLLAEVREEVILLEPPVVGFDPTKIETRDRDSILFYVHSKVPKELKQMNKDYLAMRAEVLSGENPTIPWTPQAAVSPENEFMEWRQLVLRAKP